MRRAFGVMCAVVALVAVGPSTARAARSIAAPDLRAVSGDYNQGKPLPLRGGGAATDGAPLRALAAPGETPPVGTVKRWLALDDAQNAIYFKDYTLTAVSPHMEVWVANELRFPDADCRNDQRVVITTRAGAVSRGPVREPACTRSSRRSSACRRRATAHTRSSTPRPATGPAPGTAS